jgi:1,4-alpha-glucan branching enzyme
MPATQLLHVDTQTPLGANLVPGGATFRVFAPAATAVYLLTGTALNSAQLPGFVPSSDDQLFPLSDKTWAAFLPGAVEGQPYRFWIVGNAGAGLKRDPRARDLGLNPAYPNCDCILRSPHTYPWHDAGFVAPSFNDYILYQLHVGAFYRVDANGHDQRSHIGRFLDILDRVEYLIDLGINAVQLLPVQEFPTETSLGYNNLDFYSPEMSYEVTDAADLARFLITANSLLATHGQPPLTMDQLTPGPNQLKCLIDILHLNGISVFFDLVYNHGGSYGGFDPQCINFLDFQSSTDENLSLYFTDQGYVGGRVFAYWNQDIRQFLIDNAVFCLTEYHIDGIRYDQVSDMESFGGGQCSQDMTATVRYVKPQAVQIAEYWAGNRARAVTPVPGGLGFDAAWGDQLRVQVRSAIGQASAGRSAQVDLQSVRAAFDTPSGFPAAWRVVPCLENHDIVKQGSSPRMPALADSSDTKSWYARSRCRAALGLLLAARGMPMLFMGQEFLEDQQWDDAVQDFPNLLISWSGLASSKVMQDYRQFAGDLIHLRRSQPALRSEQLRVSTADNYQRVIAVHRWINGSGHDILLVFNLQEVNRYGYRIGFPGAGYWRELFNSDFYDQLPNPATAGNGGGIVADGESWDQMPVSAQITIPANGFVVFGR